MVNQHAKWLEKCNEVPWRAKVSSLNLLITSTVWRQDHNGFTHQDPGFLDVVANKSPECRPHLPAARRQLPAVGRRPLPAQHQLRQRDRRRQAAAPAVPGHGRRGRALHQGRRHLGLGEQRPGREPDVVMACCGDVATMEALAATALLREHFPDLKVRFVNVVDLFRLVPEHEHPHGLSDREFEGLFTPDKPVIFNFHAYPWLIHRLTYRRPEPAQHPRARLQGAGQHQHAAGAGDPQPDRPVQPGDRRDRPRSLASASPAPTPARPCSTGRYRAAQEPRSTCSGSSIRGITNWQPGRSDERREVGRHDR